MRDTEELMQDLERQSAERSVRLREMLYKEGRADLVAEYDKNMRELRTGLTGARSAWHSISPAQRQALEAAAHVGALYRRYTGTGYCFTPSGLGTKACGTATVRNLISRELLAVDGGAFDPEAKVVPTEHGRFVLKHGPTAA